MLKKLLFALLIIGVSYLLLVFKFPELADKIEWFFWISINETIRMKKEAMEDFSISLPEKADIVETYKPIIDDAREVTKGVIERANDVKNKVDDVRVTLSWAADTLDKAKETVNDINEIKTEIEGIIQTGSKILNSSGTTN